MAYTGSISEDSNTQDSIPGATLWYPTPGRPRKKGQRGRPPMYEQTPARKRHKLREVVKYNGFYTTAKIFCVRIMV